MAVYREEYAQVTHHFYTLARIGCEKFIRPMPTSLVHPEMVYPGKRYEAYCLKTAEPGTEIQYEPVSDFRMDGLQPRIDLRPRTDIPKYREDEVDADPRFNEYLPHEEFVEGPEWVPGQIPPKIRSPEYGGNSSDASSDTQASCIIRAVSLTAAPEQPDQAVTSTSAGGDTRKVELKPLPGLTWEVATHLEREIQKQVEEQSLRIVQDVLQRSANRILPPTSSEAARASLSECFQKAWTGSRSTPSPAKPVRTEPPPEQSEGQECEEEVQYSLTDPFAGINPIPRQSDQPQCGRTTSRADPPRTDYLLEEKKRRSSSRPRGVVEPKRGRSSGAEPSWDVSQIGSRQTGKPQSQPSSGPEPPEPKLKSIVKSVRLSLPKPADLKSLGPAARSRYDTDPKEDWPRRERSRHCADTLVHPKDLPRSKSRSDKGSERSDRGTGRHDRKSGQSSSHKSKKDESLGAKLLARKEEEKWFKKIVENPALYIEERSNKILPEEHEPEIEAMRFFGSGAERAAIDILAIIDWAAEYVKISNHSVPDIPSFLRRPFVMGKPVVYPIPEDPTESLLKEKCVRTKAQRAWTYLCALLQFWTDLVTTGFGKVLYGGRRRPANPMIKRIRSVLNPSFGEHFKITWASIAVSTSWTQARLYFGEEDRARFQAEPGPTSEIRNRLEAAVEERWERYLKEGVQETPDRSFSTPSWAGASSRPDYSLGQPEPRHPTKSESIPPGFTRLDRKTPEEQEAVGTYRTPAEEDAYHGNKMTIDEELGAEDVTTLGNDWFPPSESEVTEAVQNLINLQNLQGPMDVDRALEERQYQIFNAEEADALGPYQTPGSPITTEEDRALDTPGGFSRAPGDGRPLPGSPAGASGLQITGWTNEGPE